MAFEFLKKFINDNCIFRCPPGYFLKGCRPGEAYSWQFYLRNAIYNQKALNDIVSWLALNYDPNVQYAAMESAGPPILSAFILAAHHQGIEIDSFAIRKERKKYGLFNYIEGVPNPDKPVVIIDDIANSKTTILRAKQICEEDGLKVSGALAIVNKDTVPFVDNIPVRSIFSLNDFDLTWDDYYKNTSVDVDGFVKSCSSVLYKQIDEKTVEPVSAAPVSGWLNTLDS